jgi:hypothetical protein
MRTQPRQHCYDPSEWLPGRPTLSTCSQPIAMDPTLSGLTDASIMVDKMLESMRHQARRLGPCGWISSQMAHLSAHRPQQPVARPHPAIEPYTLMALANRNVANGCESIWERPQYVHLRAISARGKRSLDGNIVLGATTRVPSDSSLCALSSSIMYGEVVPACRTPAEISHDLRRVLASRVSPPPSPPSSTTVKSERTLSSSMPPPGHPLPTKFVCAWPPSPMPTSTTGDQSKSSNTRIMDPSQSSIVSPSGSFRSTKTARFEGSRSPSSNSSLGRSSPASSICEVDAECAAGLLSLASRCNSMLESS